MRPDRARHTRPRRRLVPALAARGRHRDPALPDFELRRRVESGPATLRARYELHADPGYRLIWAAHALLDVTPAARLAAPHATPTRLFPEAAELLAHPWPASAHHLTGPWPAPHGLRLDRLGPDDGTAVGAILTDCASVTVIDGPDTLTLSLRTDADVPVSVALWRNLRGFPAPTPTAASASNRCSDPSSTWPRPGPATPRPCHPAARCAGSSTSPRPAPAPWTDKAPRMNLTDLPYRTLAIVRGTDRDAALRTVLTLAEEGITATEVSLTTPGALWVIERARRELGPHATLGAGTVLSGEDAARAADAARASWSLPASATACATGRRPNSPC